MREPTVLIVGGEAAGNACASKLRRCGFGGGIRIIDAEASARVNRTLVNEGVLTGLLTPEQVARSPAPDVERRPGRAVGLDRAAAVVHLEDGSALALLPVFAVSLPVSASIFAAVEPPAGADAARQRCFPAYCGYSDGQYGCSRGTKVDRRW